MWSFGILLYELLCGLPPYNGSLSDISLGIFSQEVEIPDYVEPRAADLIRRLLVKDPEEVSCYFESFILEEKSFYIILFLFFFANMFIFLNKIK